MRLWVRTIVLLLAPSVAFAAGTPPAARQFAITGTVVNAKTGAPIGSAHLTAVRVRTGAADPAAGGVTGRIGGRGSIVVGLSGQADGAPELSNPQVRAGRGVSAQTQSPAVDADVHGRFSIVVPGAGSWRLTAFAPGFRQQSYSEHEGFSSAVVLSETAPKHELTMRLEPDALLTGLVRDEAGEPVEHAQITVERIAAKIAGEEVPASPRVAGNATSDDLGRYEVSALAPGNYRVRVQATPGTQRVRMRASIRCKAAARRKAAVLHRIHLWTRYTRRPGFRGRPIPPARRC